jgi:hypothetical protein
VLSLPERIWTPDIVWEKEDSDSDSPATDPPPAAAEHPTSVEGQSTPAQQDSHTHSAQSRSTEPINSANNTSTGASSTLIPPPPPISAADVITPPALDPSDPDPMAVAGIASSSVQPNRLRTSGAGTGTGKARTKSGGGKKYFAKDECAICMESFVRGEVVRILPCGHVFHKEECDEWLLKWRKLVSSSIASFHYTPSPRTR